MILGITGGTGCGKTTLLEEIEARGGLVLDCDAIYHGLLETDPALLAAIEARFPGVVEQGSLRRRELGRRVFQDAQALLDLNRITHGAVRAEVKRRLAQGPGLAAIDAIALVEAELSGLCDVTVAVTAPTESRVRRLMERDKISEDYARSRIEAQKSELFYAQNTDYVLKNDGTLAQFRQRCRDFVENLLSAPIPGAEVGNTRRNPGQAPKSRP